MQEHENLVKAIILTESRGNGVDLMQSSESAYGQMGAITTQEGSIDQGVKYLSEMIAEAKALGLRSGDSDPSVQFWQRLYCLRQRKEAGRTRSV